MLYGELENFFTLSNLDFFRLCEVRERVFSKWAETWILLWPNCDYLWHHLHFFWHPLDFELSCCRDFGPSLAYFTRSLREKFLKTTFWQFLLCYVAAFIVTIYDVKEFSKSVRWWQNYGQLKFEVLKISNLSRTSHRVWKRIYQRKNFDNFL